MVAGLKQKVHELLTEETWCQGALYLDKDGFVCDRHKAVRYSLWGALLKFYRDNFTWEFAGFPDELGDDIVAAYMRQCLQEEFGLTDFQEFNDKSDFKTVHHFCLRNGI